MVKSSSVSTLLAAATLSEGAAVRGHGHIGQWHSNAGVPPGGFDRGVAAQEMTAASLLLAAEPLGSSQDLQHGSLLEAGRSLGAVGMQAMPRTADMLSARGSARSKGGVGLDSARPPRRVGSAQDLASSTTREKQSGGIIKAAAGKGATRASNRRANSRYAKDKVKGLGAEKEGVAEVGKGAEPPAVELPGELKSEQQLKEEHMEVGPELVVLIRCRRAWKGACRRWLWACSAGEAGRVW
jgi:hypothetical protein